MNHLIRHGLDEPTARRFYRHLLAALRYTHARGFLHCDLQPANIMLAQARDGALTAVLVDWGLARQIDRQPVPTQGLEPWTRPTLRSSCLSLTSPTFEVERPI